jgi:hypothetical protein
VDLQWQPSADDPAGTGIGGYRIYRNGALVGTTQSTTFSDGGVSPGTNYSYAIHAFDRHMNLSPPATVEVRTPTIATPGANTDARRIGVRPLGSYWGAAGEQIDLRSGNLNFRLPLLRAVGRGRWGVDFALSYNSQLWRQDPGGTWQLGQDVGYGFGWQLMAGSLTPIWVDAYTFGYYLYTDSTGSEYRLDVYNNGIWTSRQGIYVEYDETAARLYFPDGSFWQFGCVSAGGEPDGGSRYPTLMQDSNGNRVLLRYLPGAGSPFPDTSARIDQIEDVRAGYGGIVYPTWFSYRFTYNTDAVPHLTGIQSYGGASEDYEFAYATQSLYSPLSPPAPYGTTSLLQAVTETSVPQTHTFEYDPSGSGELTRAVLPYGGHLRWAYRPFTFAGGISVREVQERYVASAGAPEKTYRFWHDDAGDAGRDTHYYTSMHDPSGPERVWWFETLAGSPAWGLLVAWEQRTEPCGPAL